MTKIARKESGGIMLGDSPHTNYPHRTSLGLVITINIWAGRVFNIFVGKDRWDGEMEGGSWARVKAINKSSSNKQLLQARERERESVTV